MVDYGEHNADEAPTSMRVGRVARKYRWHKLSRALGNLKRNRRDRG